MKIESDGILIDIRPLNERDSLAHVFTPDYGVLVGMMRGAVVAKKNRPLVGQIGGVVWNARVDSQLGVFHWDATRNLSAPLMYDARKLAMMNAAFGLMRTLLPEREVYPELYSETIAMLNAIGGGAENYSDFYQAWEIAFLGHVGFALDMKTCAGCGGVHDLIYMSPRTFHAVCAACGAPYADRLYKLPLNLRVTRQLLERVCMSCGASMPVARMMLD